MAGDLKKLSDEELDKKIQDKYGKDWTIEDVDDKDAVIREFFRRLAILYG